MKKIRARGRAEGMHPQLLIVYCLRQNGLRQLSTVASSCQSARPLEIILRESILPNTASFQTNLSSFGVIGMVYLKLPP